jgi:hypothetical protein
MPVNGDVLQIVRILDEEGFGALAGELLMEISLGRELDVGRGDVTMLDRPSFSEDDLDLDAWSRREPIPDDEQLGEAVNFLCLRLVEPMRRLAEVERIAADLLHDVSRERDPAGSDAKTPANAIRIAFVNSRGEPVTGYARSEEAGEESSAKELDEVLNRIKAQVT